MLPQCYPNAVIRRNGITVELLTCAEEVTGIYFATVGFGLVFMPGETSG